MSNYLTHIVERKQAEVQELLEKIKNQKDHPLHSASKIERTPSGNFAKALRGPQLSVIAEVKRKSPSVGEIHKIEDPASLALAYCRGGASAISVLTDFAGFGGTLNDLKLVSDAVRLHYPDVPTLRKDFIVDPIQLIEAAHSGASAVLLIVNVLGKELKHYLTEAARLGLETLTEIHTANELEQALEAGSSVIGINHRNLETFKIDLDLSKSLRPMFPKHVITVAESGIHTADQAQEMRQLGYDAVLVGEALVRAQDPATLIAQMRGERDGS